MKLGIAMSTYPTNFGPIVLSGDDIESNIALASDLGYTGLDLFVDDKSEKEIDQISQTLRDHRMEVAMFIAIYLAESGTNLADPDESERLKAVQKYKTQVARAVRMSARKMPVGFIRGNIQEGENAKAYLDRLARSMSELLDFTAPKGIEVCLEPINRYEMNSLLTVEEAVEFIDTYRLDGLKILADLFHMNIEDTSIEGSLRTGGKRIAHMHVADSNRLAPGQGHLDYRTVIDTLRSTGFDGYLSIEAFPRPNAKECARQGAEYLTSILEG